MAHILIVEDDKTSSDALSVLLEQSGHEVQCAPSGHEALGAVMSATPDLIVLDLGLPGPNGANVLAILRSYLRLQRLPVVIWTGLADGELAQEARDLGAAAVVQKGNSPDEILGAVEHALKNQAN